MNPSLNSGLRIMRFLKNWTEYLLVDHPELDLMSAVRLLDRLPIKNIFLVDQDQKVLGSVSDGDIRRAIIENGSLSSPLNLAVNNKFKGCYASDLNEIDWDSDYYNDCKSVPIVDSDGLITGIVSHTASDRNLIEHFDLLVMAGGKGMRLRPLTEHIPKALVSLGNKTLIDLVIEQFIPYGIRKVWVSLGYFGQQVRDHLDSNYGCLDIEYVQEETPLGTAGALNLLDLEKIKFPLFVINCDVICEFSPEHVLAFHEEKGADVTIGVVPQRSTVEFGVVEFDEKFNVTQIDEKPTYIYWVAAGVYVLSERAVTLLREWGQDAIDMPDVINEFLSRNLSVKSYPIGERWIDVGRHEDLATIRGRLIEREKN